MDSCNAAGRSVTAHYDVSEALDMTTASAPPQLAWASLNLDLYRDCSCCLAPTIFPVSNVMQQAGQFHNF